MHIIPTHHACAFLQFSNTCYHTGIPAGGKRRLTGGWEGEGGAGWQEYQFCSSPQGPRYEEAAGREGGESRCMGIQKSLHMHATQTPTANYSFRKNNAQEGQGEVDVRDWSGEERNCRFFLRQIQPVSLSRLTKVSHHGTGHHGPPESSLVNTGTNALEIDILWFV